MSYEPTNWKTGDVVTAAKLNKLENGVAEGGGGGSGALIVNINTDLETGVMTMDKTWHEIFDAPYCVMKSVTTSGAYQSGFAVVAYTANTDGVAYNVIIASGSSVQIFTTDSPDGYPMYDPNAQSGS